MDNNCNSQILKQSSRGGGCSHSAWPEPRLGSCAGQEQDTHRHNSGFATPLFGEEPYFCQLLLHALRLGTLLVDLPTIEHVCQQNKQE